MADIKAWPIICKFVLKINIWLCPKKVVNLDLIVWR